MVYEEDEQQKQSKDMSVSEGYVTRSYNKIGKDTARFNKKVIYVKIDKSFRCRIFHKTVNVRQFFRGAEFCVTSKSCTQKRKIE